MSEYPPKPGSADEARSSSDEAELIDKVQREILENGHSLIAGMVDLVDVLARESSDDGDKNKYKDALDAYISSDRKFNSLFDKIESHEGPGQGEDISQLDEGLRSLYIDSARYEKMSPEEQREFNIRVEVYIDLYGTIDMAFQRGTPVLWSATSSTTSQQAPNPGDLRFGGDPKATSGTDPDADPTTTTSSTTSQQAPNPGDLRFGGDPKATSGTDPDADPTTTTSSTTSQQAPNPGDLRFGRPASPDPDRNAGRPETKEQRRKRLEKELAKLNEELDAPYAAKLNAYAELLAKEESKRSDSGFRLSIMHWVGGPGKNRKREKRREALDEAGKALKKEVLAYLHQKVETKRQNGEYQGTDDEIAQQMSDEMFDEQRKIFGQRLQERKDEILRSESDKLRNRILAKIGSWIGMEKSTKNSLKAAAVGVGHGLVKGAAVGALTGLFGVTWPISVGVSIVAATIGDRMIRRGIRLDAIRQGLGGQNGSRQLVDDDKFARIKEKAEGKKRSQEFMADKMLKLSRKDSYAAGDRLSKETNERLNKHKVALGIGRLAGGAVGGIGGRWVGQQLHDHTPVGQAVDRAKRNVHEFFRGDTAAAAPDNPPPPPPPEANFSGYADKYPWDWAVDQFGENNAVSKLYELADAAAQDGHNIQWHGYGETQWLSIDGKSDTQSVLEILNKYNYGLAA